MDLALPYPPEPEFMARHAETAVALVAEYEGIHLTYSASSAEVIDEVIVTLRAAGETAESVGEALFAFGAYVGEILVRLYDCTWVAALGLPPQVKLLSDQLVNPVGRALRAITPGEHPSFAEFLQALVLADQGDPEQE